jgi:periplasmic divalent cation tolerance protein
MTDCGIVFMTASSREEAEKIANSLVEKRLAACVQLVSDIRSVYWWEGKICDDREVLLSAKTTAGLFPELAAAVKSLHSYQVPEIVFVPIQDGLPEYLDWMHQVTKQ